MTTARAIVFGARRWRNVLIRALQQSGISCARVPVDAMRPDDMAVGLFDVAQSRLAEKLSLSTHRRDVRSLCGVVHADEVVLGPLVVPRQGACWNCAQLRLAANARLRDVSAVDREHEPLDFDAFLGRFLAREVRRAMPRPHAGNGDPHLFERLLVLNRRTLQLSSHRLTRVPGCSVCGGATWSGGPDAFDARREPGPQDDFGPDALSRLVDSRVGVIHRVWVEPASLTGLELPCIASALTADAPDFRRPARPMPLGWGKGLTLSDAVTGAMAESLERYCASMVDRTRLRHCTLAELEGEVLDPRVFALYRKAQYQTPGFPFARFNPQIIHPWVDARWACCGDPVWVPAILIYLWLELTNEQLFCQGSSNGLAAGRDSASAALAAIVELIERDAFLSSWLCRRPGRRLIDRSGLSDEENTVVEGILALGGRVEIVLLQGACNYWTAVCLAFGDGTHWPGVTLGLGADRSPRTAVRRAVLEQGQAGPYLRRLMRTNSHPVPEDVHAVKTMLDHAAYYFRPERAVAFGYLLEGEPIRMPIDMPDAGADSFVSCASALAAAGIRVALVDITSADVATTPLRVVRAVSPDLQDISFGSGLERSPVPRLATRAAQVHRPGVLPVW